MKTVCEQCGKTSMTENVCSHCEATIPAQTDMDTPFVDYIWGWASFDVGNIPKQKHNELLEQIQEQLEELEKFTVLKLTNSQIENVVIKNFHVKLFLREDMYKQLLSKLVNNSSHILGSFQKVGYFTYASEANDILKLQNQSVH